jgi:uncharacterized protein (DUF1697 family)
MGGHNKIKMVDLAAMFTSLGFRDVVTYIQSGNVVFHDPLDSSDEVLSTRIENGISETFKLNISAVIRHVEEIEGLIPRNPYLAEKNFDPARMGVVFLRKAPDQAGLKKMEGISFPPDKFEISGSEIFLFCPNGFGRSKLSTNYFENKMKVTGTARNWQTILKMLELANKQI